MKDKASSQFCLSIPEAVVEFFPFSFQVFSVSGRAEARGKTDGILLLMLPRFFDLLDLRVLSDLEM